MRILWPMAAVALLAAPAARGEGDPGPRLVNELGFALAFPTGVVPSVSYLPALTFFGERLHVGLGARFSSYLDEGRVDYPNGDPDLLAIGAQNTLTVDGPRNYALNLMFGASVRIVRGLEVGLNIDLLGVGFGPEVTGTYAGTDPAFAGPQRASPTRFNLLRAGVSHMSTEYTTSRELDAGNDRFRTSATRFFLGGDYRF
jgi:hypothetical protein